MGKLVYQGTQNLHQIIGHPQGGTRVAQLVPQGDHGGEQQHHTPVGPLVDILPLDQPGGQIEKHAPQGHDTDPDTVAHKDPRQKDQAEQHNGQDLLRRQRSRFGHLDLQPPYGRIQNGVLGLECAGEHPSRHRNLDQHHGESENHPA
ncbi:hypothetical protein ES707_21422 [subsurface metagenome]